MLQTSRLGCERRGRVLFEDLSFDVGPGVVLRVEGGNGAGKTTLLRMLCGLYQDYTGTIVWDLVSYPLYMGHRPGVNNVLTARENLRYLVDLYQKGTPGHVLDEALAAVGLGGLADATTGTLSEGQRKRVGLARFLVVKSPAWILDEPFSAIDAAGARWLEQLMAEQVASGGIILLTSHLDHKLPMATQSLRLGL